LIATCSRRIRFVRPAEAKPSSFLFADSGPQPSNINAAETKITINNLFVTSLHIILQLLSGRAKINGEGGIPGFALEPKFAFGKFP